MRHYLLSTPILSLAIMSLSACTTLPSSTALTKGIDPAVISKAQSATAMRAHTDPVCENFYKNVQTYTAKASQPNQGTNFLAAIGIGVLGAMAGGGIATAGLGQVGQVAAQTATTQALSMGSQATLRSLKSSDKADAKIIDVANELRCPVSVTT